MWDSSKTQSAVKGVVMAAVGAGLAVLAAYQWEADFGPMYGPIIAAALGAAVNVLRLAAMPPAPAAAMPPEKPVTLAEHLADTNSDSGKKV